MREATKIAFFLALLSFRLFADDGTDNDRRHRYGEGKNKDGAAYIGDQKTKQQLTPNMVQHYAQSTMHFMTGNIPMGQMEQMKGNLLKQQIDENKKSADKNRESEKLLYDYQDTPAPQVKADPRVNTVDKDRLANKAGVPGAPEPIAAPSPAAPPVAPVTPSPAAPVAEQLATLGPRTGSTPDVSAAPETKSPALESKAAESIPSAPTSAGTTTVATSSPDWQKDLEGLSKGGTQTTEALAQNVSSDTQPQLSLGGGVILATAPGTKGSKKDEDPFSGVGKEDTKGERGIAALRKSSRADRRSGGRRAGTKPAPRQLAVSP